MTEYIAYIVKVGNGYLAKDPKLSLMEFYGGYSKKYKQVEDITKAEMFHNYDVVTVAKKYGGQAVGLLPVLLEDEA